MNNVSSCQEKIDSLYKIAEKLNQELLALQIPKDEMSHIFSALKLSYLADVQDVVEESVIVFGLLNKLKGQQMEDKKAESFKICIDTAKKMLQMVEDLNIPNDEWSPIFTALGVHSSQFYTTSFEDIEKVGKLTQEIHGAL